MANVTVNKINTSYSEEYTEQDLRLIPAFDVISQFNPESDEVEFVIYNEQGLLESINYDYKDYTVTLDYNTQQNSVSTVNVNPETDVIKAGYEQGNYNVVYNFFRNQLSSSFDNPFYIKQISSDRTELRIANNNIGNEELERLVNEFKSELSSSAYFEDFQLNFGNNNIFIANNILIDNSTPSQYTILIKLYEPLDGQFNVKDTLWVTLQTAEEASYQVSFSPIVVEGARPKQLKGPNFDIKSKDIINNSTTYQNLNTLTSVPLTSSYNELQSILEEKGIEINIDYSDFNNFVYFSSAEERVRNFYYKVSEIQSYQNEIDTLGGLSNSQVSSSLVILENKIQDVIKNFDGYEKYQYYSSGSSDIYPKTNSTAPYNLAGTGSAAALAWLTDQATNSGSAYDLENPDRLVNTLPSFVKDDTRNSQFFLFMDMIGQHFDNIWVYTKDVSNRFDADNRLNYGISKDIVADAIRSMGVNLYQNNFSSDDLYSALLGINSSGSLLPPTGSEVIETYVTASSDVTKLDNVNKEIYKRIYHNLPYLLKKKGTVEGLRALINTYGIPDTILRISEFGGKDKDNSNDWDYFQNKFNYALYNSGSSTTNRIQIPWDVNSNWDSNSDNPESFFLKFKPGNILPEGEERNILLYKSGIPFYLTLDYTGSAYSSGSYSGSIPSSSNEYATLTLWDNISEVSHIDAPFYDGNWWGVQVSREGILSSADVVLRIANSIYNGNDGFKIGYTASSTVANDFGSWNSGVGTPTLYIPHISNASVTLGGNVYYGLTGSFQELRFYNTSSISEATFHDYVMNPYSIEGLNYSSSAHNLIFRAPLGSDLNTSTGTLTSIHPKITGSNTTHSFASDSNYIVGADLIYYPQTEFVYYDQPAVGIKNRISEKIKLVNNILPSGDTLSSYRTIQQRYPQSESYTRDVNYVEVAFSPQNEINDDINSSMGYFNIGEYIGDPQQVSQSINTYPDLDKLRDSYFEKYYKNYDWTDYVRLIKYFDNSLFKMIKDFVPAKSSVSTGVVIKQHLLERNKQRPAQVELSQYDYSGSITSSFVEGGSSGVFNDTNNGYSNASTITLRGATASILRRDGVLSITNFNSFLVSSGDLGVTGSEGGLEINNNVVYPFKNTTTTPIQFDFSLEGVVADSSINAGEIQIFSDRRFTTSSSEFLDKRNAGAIYSASLGNLSVSDPISINAQNLIIYPEESLCVTLSDSDSAAETIIECDVTFSYSKLNNNPTLNTQYWHYSVDTQYGPQIINQSTQDEFYNGELSGSTILVTDGNLNVPIFQETNDSFISDYEITAAYNDWNQFYTGFVSTPDGFFSYYWELGNQEEGTPFVSHISIADDDSDGNDREAYFDSLSQGDVLTFKVIEGIYSINQIFNFTIGNIEKTTSGLNKRYIISVASTNANGGDWYANRTTNGVLNPPAFKLKLIYDDSTNEYQGLNFEDSNPLYNNVSDVKLSNTYMDIDYSTGVNIPTNFTTLINGSAVKAPVQDSNYSQKTWVNSRYNGSRISSTDFNIKTRS